MSVEFKPCPFCGAKKDDEDEPLGVWWSVDFEDWIVLCDRCGANTGRFNRQEREEAIAAWNRRYRNDNQVI